MRKLKTKISSLRYLKFKISIFEHFLLREMDEAFAILIQSPFNFKSNFAQCFEIYFKKEYRQISILSALFFFLNLELFEMAINP